MSTISLQDLAKDLGAQLDRVEGGEGLVIIRNGRPAAELRPVESTRKTPRPFGLAAGTFTVPVDFDAAIPGEVLKDI
jgi:antitoxin (DNA-binding transcriptional repressor) of toxin-antitoxin stability system